MMFDLIMLADGANVLETANRLTNQTTAVLRNVALLAAIATVTITYFKTKAWVPTFVAILVASVMLWAVNNDAFLRNSTDRTIREARLMDARVLAAADAAAPYRAL